MYAGEHIVKMEAETYLHPDVRRVQMQYLAGLTPPMKVRDLTQPKCGDLLACSRAQNVLSSYCASPPIFKQVTTEQTQMPKQTDN